MKSELNDSWFQTDLMLGTPRAAKLHCAKHHNLTSKRTKKLLESTPKILYVKKHSQTGAPKELRDDTPNTNIHKYTEQKQHQGKYSNNS